MKQNSVESGFINAGAAAWIPPTTTFASAPQSPATGSVYLFTDALTPGANVGGGTSLSTCRWSGSAWVSAGAGPATIQDEGVILTQRTVLNFVGAGVTATDDSANGRTVVTVPGGYADPLTTKGDLLARSASATTRMAVGTVANQTLLVDSAQALGIKWATMTAAMITNAVDQTGSYTNPAWIVSIPWSKVTGAPAAVVPAGVSGQVQYNNAGAFGASGNLFWDITNSRLGIGTASPGTLLHCYKSQGGGITAITVSNDGGGTGVGTAVRFAYGAAFPSMGGIYHDYNGADWMLRLKAFNNSAEVERLTIHGTTGSVGIGTTSPTNRFQVAGNVAGLGSGTYHGADATVSVDSTNNAELAIGWQGAAAFAMWMQSRGPGGVLGLILQPAGGNVGIGTASPGYQLQLSTDSAAKPGTNAWTVASDERLKRNIQPFTEGLGTLLQFDPLAYEYNGLDGTPEGMKAVGLSAQQAITIYPPMVKTHVGTIAEKEVTLLDLNNSDLTWMMVNAFKQVDARLKLLEGKP